MQPVIIMETQRRLALVGGAEAANKGQIHQRVFQPLGFVDGDYLDPVIITFQPQDAFLAAVTLLFEGFFQIANQGLLAIQLSGHLLQQFRQVQQVGQCPLAIQALAEAHRDMKIHQQTAQHGQHALLLPLVPIAMELFHHTLPAHLILVDGIQFRIGYIQ